LTRRHAPHGEAASAALESIQQMIINFGYVIDNELAGLAHPDSFGDVHSALAELRQGGICALVSLDEIGISPAIAAEHGLRYLHIPVPDFHAPETAQANEFVDFVSECRKEGRPVAVHCRGGYGRTGTLIACYLIASGMSAKEAIDLVRRRRPGSIETAGQERFLDNFEKDLRRNG
jgi:atypical dual specificity phosphatase